MFAPARRRCAQTLAKASSQTTDSLSSWRADTRRLQAEIWRCVFRAKSHDTLSMNMASCHKYLLKFVLLLVDRRAPLSQALALVQMPNGAIIRVGYKRDWGTRNLVSRVHQRQLYIAFGRRTVRSVTRTYRRCSLNNCATSQVLSRLSGNHDSISLCSLPLRTSV